ncbi:Acyl-CoA dehydrogenase [Rubripirellula lacrimiformis]|uniref:Acyl-CoA dehydrogenase n=1 Tax=Rubripirellula lacrimiformis TaxID=1930273 RepID=A0A517NEB8_9BACT|nr:acyl-CoA dehydrogenase family protein [Rubripirellula lacrimiformis]QDT05462.1 Acyl-CoA dehydrogenase [Rubripirellula lacrimiformis]
MSSQPLVESPTGPAMDALCESLRDAAPRWHGVNDWPGESLRRCGQSGVYRWFLPRHAGGMEWSDTDQTRGYLRLAEADLTTTFIITQYMGAIRRIVSSGNQSIMDRYVESLSSGKQFGTVGISHLTTSRRHLAKPVLMATETKDGFRLDGMSPWVTGAPHADVYVIGATLDDGRQILAAVPSDLPGVVSGAGTELIALSASCTDQVRFDGVLIDHASLLAGPEDNVMTGGSGARTGGLQTSTLAVGLARAAGNYLASESDQRPDLREASDELTKDIDQLEASLLRVGREGDSSEGCDPSEIRGQANRLVLRTTQAALTAAKGAGFVQGHLVGRLCQQALFFLVWSCPAPVAQSHLCELAFGSDHRSD